jgi:hypothetical protein
MWGLQNDQFNFIRGFHYVRSALLVDVKISFQIASVSVIQKKMQEKLGDTHLYSDYTFVVHPSLPFLVSVVPADNVCEPTFYLHIKKVRMVSRGCTPDIDYSNIDITMNIVILRR